MTGVGGRPEVVVEGATGPDGPWKEYEFLYKPGSLDRRPPVISKPFMMNDFGMWALLDELRLYFRRRAKLFLLFLCYRSYSAIF